MLFRNFSSKRLKGSQSYKLSVKKASIIIYGWYCMGEKTNNDILRIMKNNEK